VLAERKAAGEAVIKKNQELQDQLEKA